MTHEHRQFKNFKAQCTYMTRDGYSSVYVQWEKGGCRYHVWINEKNNKREPIETLFKNPLEGIKSGEPGFFDTRRLQPFNTANRRDVEYALKVADVERARSEYILKEEREKAEREQNRKDQVARDRLNAAAPLMYDAIRDVLDLAQPELPSHIIKQLSAALNAADGGAQ